MLWFQRMPDGVIGLNSWFLKRRCFNQQRRTPAFLFDVSATAPLGQGANTKSTKNHQQCAAHFEALMGDNPESNGIIPMEQESFHPFCTLNAWFWYLNRWDVERFVSMDANVEKKQRHPAYVTSKVDCGNQSTFAAISKNMILLQAFTKFGPHKKQKLYVELM